MDEKGNTVIADDRESSSSISEKSDKKTKEKCDIIYEVNAICNIDRYSLCNMVVSSPSLINDDSFQYSSNTVSEQPDQFVHLKNSPNNISNHNYLSYHQSLSSGDIYQKEGHSFHFKSSLLVQDDKAEESLNISSKKRQEKIKDSDVSYNDDPAVTDPFPGHDSEHNISSNESLNLQEDSKRASRRSSKRKKEFDECCPVCGVTVRLNDLQSHYSQEVERLSKISRTSRKSQSLEITRNKTFEEVRKNRESRLTARVARYKARAQNEVKCPVCSLRMSGTAEEINKHVAFCIQDEDSDVVVDDEDEGNESYEEYEFGDQTRIRPISLVPGGYRTLQGQPSVRLNAEEEEDLNVDVDDAKHYGEPQYSEMDVIPNTSSDQDRTDLEKLRKAVFRDSFVQSHNLEQLKWSKSEIEEDNSESITTCEEFNPVVSSLKEKIKELEDQDKSVKCLICLESYTKPVVSTTCWHVHCEECWLMTMGVKKLCPQCNMIVFPSDLRKIYL